MWQEDKILHYGSRVKQVGRPLRVVTSSSKSFERGVLYTARASRVGKTVQE